MKTFLKYIIFCCFGITIAMLVKIDAWGWFVELNGYEKALVVVVTYFTSGFLALVVGHSLNLVASNENKGYGVGAVFFFWPILLFVSTVVWFDHAIKLSVTYFCCAVTRSAKKLGEILRP